MGVPDAAHGPTRVQSVWQAVRPQLPAIDAHFVPAWFTFDTTLHPLDRPEALATATADGRATDVAGAVRAALSHTNREDAAVVLITDGIDNVSADVAEALRGVARPIHTVRVGSDQATPASVINVAVDDVAAPEEFAVHAAADVTVTVRSTGLAGRVVDVKLAETDAAGKPTGEVTSRRLVLTSAADGQAATVPYTPTAAGLRTVSVWVDPVAGERTAADNRQAFQALAVDPRIKVLYVEGSVRLEYKWTRQAFLSDANVELATYLRKTPTSVEAGGTVDGKPFHDLPNTPAGWAAFDVIVIGDVDGTYLGPQRLQQIEQRTADGGGLLMLGRPGQLRPRRVRWHAGRTRPARLRRPGHGCPRQGPLRPPPDRPGHGQPDPRRPARTGSAWATSPVPATCRR